MQKGWGRGLLPTEVNRDPLLIVFSGPSGVGKDTVIEAVRASGFDIHHVVTCTTRPPRPTETNGLDYYFVSVERFAELIADNELLEYADVHGYRYGTPIKEVREAFARGEDALLKIDVQGGLQVKRRLPQAVFVFLVPPSPEVLLAQLRNRQTESAEELERRTSDAEFELNQRNSYDYVIVNQPGNVKEAARELKSIIVAEKLRIHRQPIDLGRTKTGTVTHGQ
jgi:guanylate kinase